MTVGIPPIDDTSGIMPRPAVRPTKYTLLVTWHSTYAIRPLPLAEQIYSVARPLSSHAHVSHAHFSPHVTCSRAICVLVSSPAN